jgi:hypothetical protein
VPAKEKLSMRKSYTTQWVAIAVVLAGSALFARPAHAQANPGVRAGVSVNPDQFYFGGHIETTPLVDRVRFRPNVEVGVGNNTTLAAFNFEFIYPFASRQPWHVYAGAGPAINYYRTNGASDAKGGFNILFGLENTKGMFFEVKLGVIDSPDLKVGVGYTFK